MKKCGAESYQLLLLLVFVVLFSDTQVSKEAVRQLLQDVLH
jgi:hypothetical protein